MQNQLYNKSSFLASLKPEGHVTVVLFSSLFASLCFSIAAPAHTAVGWFNTTGTVCFENALAHETQLIVTCK